MHIIGQAIVLLFALFASVKLMLHKESNTVVKFIALLVIIITLWLVFQRDTYLPFLGYAAFPKSLLPNDFSPVNANTEITLHVDASDGTRLIYWGAMSSDKPNGVFGDPRTAYGNYSNAGVATVKRGEANVRFHCPGEYKVMGGGRQLKRHIHYRLCCQKSGLLGPVQTAWVKC